MDLTREAFTTRRLTWRRFLTLAMALRSNPQSAFCVFLNDKSNRNLLTPGA